MIVFQCWMMKHESLFKAFCKLCTKATDLNNIEKGALTSHAKSKWHKKAVSLKQGTGKIEQFMKLEKKEDGMTSYLYNRHGHITYIIWDYIIITIYVNDILFCCHANYHRYDAIITMYFIGYHNFFTLLPECYYEVILLDVHPPNHHI